MIIIAAIIAYIIPLLLLLTAAAKVYIDDRRDREYVKNINDNGSIVAVGYDLFTPIYNAKR